MCFCVPLMLLAQVTDDRGYIVNVGDKCPDFELSFPDGSKTSLESLRGQVFMLQFTASWCSVCRKEMPHIEDEIWKVYKEKGLAVIGVDRGETAEVVEAFAKKMKVTYPLALDEDESVFQKFALPKAGVTRNILVNREGKIVYLTRLYNIEEFEGLKARIAAEFN
jgi:peroxiredoxin